MQLCSNKYLRITRNVHHAIYIYVYEFFPFRGIYALPYRSPQEGKREMPCYGVYDGLVVFGFSIFKV